jgi:hypothetical protein
MTNRKSLILSPNTEVIEASGVQGILAQVRPEWQAKNLIKRVESLLPVDPSSACQRLFNASIHDLKEKIIVAGLDIAQEAAKQHKLPPLSKAEDVEDYSVMRTIDLSYRMGLLTRPEWRRLLRAYDIRRDLEHEDDEYEAGVEDCVYIFKTCIDVVLSKDPVQLLKLTDIKEVVEESSPSTLTDAVLEDFEHAPEPRQHEIYKFLIGVSLDPKQPDIVRQNCYNALYSLSDLVHKNVLLSSAREMVERIRRRVPELAEIRVAWAAGILPYLKKTQLRDFYQSYLALMKRTSFHWKSHSSHGELLRNLEEIGGLDHCPDEILDEFLEWLVLCYIGEPGGYGMGINRRVFYSNIGAPIAMRILRDANLKLSERVAKLRKSSKRVKAGCGDEHVARRFEDILDALGS